MDAVQATGRVVRDRDGLELLVERRMAAPAPEVWEWLTSSARLGEWIGTWEGEPAVGGEIRFTMTFEQDAAPETVTILECDPSRRFRVRWGTGTLGIALAEIDGVTTVYLSQRLSDAREAGSTGPGWEYYLDRLVAAHQGSGAPDFEDYYPTQRPYFERLAMDGDPEAWPAS